MAVQQAPDFTIGHIEGHTVSLSDYPGKKVVMFAARNSADQAKQATQAIRKRYDAEELPVLLIIDVSSLPRVMHRVAKSQLKKGYAEAVEMAKADYAQNGKSFPADASKVVVMLPDYDGSVTASFDVGDVDKAAAAVLVDEGGKVIGSASGPGAGEQILQLVD